MDAKLKEKWVKALRSGAFEQSSGFLLDGTGAMCCLGVLAHIQGYDLSDLTTDERMTSFLPRGYNAGLLRKQRSRLASMNDGTFDSFRCAGEVKHSFPEIADYIEKNI